MQAEYSELDATLVEGCAPIFNLVEPLRNPDRAESVPAELRKDLEQAFLELERRAFEKQWPSSMTRDVRFGMAAYVDEMVMSSRWPHKFDWMVKPLCVEFFGESNAGEAFFDRLEELRQDLSNQRLVVELYFSCLQFGYQGCYRIRGYEPLQALVANLRAELEDLNGPVPRDLADQAVPESRLVYRIGGNQPYWVMASIGAAAMMSLFLAYGAMMRTSLEDSAEHLIEREMATSQVNREATDG